MATKTDVINLGPMLLLDADTITGNDGDAIGTWGDDSGQSHTFSQGTANAKPLLKKAANGINSHNVLRFDGSNDTLVGPALSHLIANNAYTMWVIFKAIALDTNAAQMYNNDTIISDRGEWWGIYMKSAPTIHSYVWPTAAVYTSEAIATGTAYNFRTRLASGKLYHKLGAGAETAGTTCGNVGALTNDVPLCWNDSAPCFTNADIAEIIIFNSALSSGNMDTVDAYLNAKYFPPATSWGGTWGG